MVSTVGFLVASGYDCTVGMVLMISIPSTLCSVLAAAIWSYRRGKDLDKDERFQKFISDPKNRAYVYGEGTTLANQELSKYAYRSVYIFLGGILAITCLGNMPSLLPHFSSAAGAPAKPISMVLVIQMVMMMVGAFILLGSKVNAKEAAIAIVTPMALSIGADPIIVLPFISVSYGYFFLPNYPSDLSTIGFDRTGTTRIGGLILNHSFMIPGLISLVVGCTVGYMIAHVLL